MLYIYPCTVSNREIDTLNQMKLAIKQALIYVYPCLRSFNALRLKNEGFFSSSEGAMAIFLKSDFSRAA